jgi:hypothetical protein
MGPDGARNQKPLCWRGPGAIYWTRLVPTGLPQYELVKMGNKFLCICDK